MRAVELYDSDFSEWTRHNAELLRSGRAAEADLAHIAEEIEDMGKRERRSLHNRCVRLIEHLLKRQYQPERRGSSWKRTIVLQRRTIRRLLEENPSFSPALADVVAAAYEDAARLSARLPAAPGPSFRRPARTRSRTSWATLSCPSRSARFRTSRRHRL